MSSNASDQVVLTGTIEHAAGVRHVELAFSKHDGEPGRNNQVWWEPREQRWRERYVLFEVEVDDQGATSTTWRFESDRLPSGSYVAQVFARGVDGSTRAGPDSSDTVEINHTNELPFCNELQCRRLLSPAEDDRVRFSTRGTVRTIPGDGSSVATEFVVGATIDDADSNLPLPAGGGSDATVEWKLELTQLLANGDEVAYRFDPDRCPTVVDSTTMLRGTVTGARADARFALECSVVTEPGTWMILATAMSGGEAAITTSIITVFVAPES